VSLVCRCCSGKGPGNGIKLIVNDREEEQDKQVKKANMR
jgi:hypothetical protein